MTILSKNQPLRLTPATMHEMVMQEDFSPGIISRLNEYQKKKIRRFIRARLPHCQPRERKIFSARLAMLAPDADLKQDNWEYHHANVCMAIQGYLQEKALMPTQAVLAAITGYSRQRIRKHLKAYLDHPSYIEQAETMRLMCSKVTERVLAMALQGDIRAAKVFLDTAHRAESRRARPSISQSEWMPLVQNNFIRINGLFITEEKLKGLQPEQLAQLEELLHLKEDSSLGRNENPGGFLGLNRVFTLTPMDQADNTSQFENCLPTGTNGNPDVILNPLSKSK